MYVCVWGGWSVWWRLCDAPTGWSDDSIVLYWKINNWGIEWNMLEVPYKKVALNLLDNRMEKVASVT